MTPSRKGPSATSDIENSRTMSMMRRMVLGLSERHVASGPGRFKTALQEMLDWFVEDGVLDRASVLVTVDPKTRDCNVRIRAGFTDLPQAVTLNLACAAT